MTAPLRRVKEHTEHNGVGLVLVCLAQRLPSPVSALMCVSDCLPVVLLLIAGWPPDWWSPWFNTCLVICRGVVMLRSVRHSTRPCVWSIHKSTWYFLFLFLLSFFFFFNYVHHHGCHMSAESHLTAFETNAEVTTLVRVHPVAKTDSETKAGRWPSVSSFFVYFVWPLLLSPLFSRYKKKHYLKRPQP